MKILLSALAIVAIAPGALAQGVSSPQGQTTATAVNQMDVSSVSNIFGSGNTKLSTQFNEQYASADAIGFGREAIATSDASNLLIDFQADIINGEHNTVAADDANYQDAYAQAESYSWGTPADALTRNELADSDERVVEGYANTDLRDKVNEQYGSSFAIGEPATSSTPRIRRVCTSGGLCTR
ncbi:MAG: hypothetical protein AAFR33_03780 [Pseudomonadota bacterium]